MSQDPWKINNYELVNTQDGSPTLRSLAVQSHETMHHPGGAYSETQEIYGKPLRQALAEKASSALSLGLGLGYNELLVASELLKSGTGAFQLLSFESDEFLIQQFVYFLQRQQIPCLIEETYQSIITRFGVPDKIAKKLIEMKNENAWQIEGVLNEQSLHQISTQQKYEIIFYDAFSSKTDAGLWSEDFLDHFIKQICADRCYFSTYACTGSLKRALKNNGFTVVVRPGFHGKRNSTLGVRGF